MNRVTRQQRPQIGISDPLRDCDIHLGPSPNEAANVPTGVITGSLCPIHALIRQRCDFAGWMPRQMN